MLEKSLKTTRKKREEQVLCHGVQAGHTGEFSGSSCMLRGVDRFLRSLWAGFHPAPQHFGHTSGLRDAATGRKRLFGIEDLADGANTDFAETCLKAVEEASGPA